MPELIRSVVSRVRMYVKDRRSSPRLRVRLLFSISVGRKANGNGSGQLERLLKGHTRDISQNGLALNVSQVHLDGHHLATEGRNLQLRLELPGGPISMLVTPRRYERLDEAELGCGYLIGVQIVQISDEDRRLYLSFITHGLQGNL
jgi:hypothetical protein